MNFFLTICLNEMFILRTLITWESTTYYFPFRLTVKRIPLSARQSLSVAIEVLHGSHVARQEQKIPFPMGREALSYAKYFHCSCHAKPL